MTRPYIADAKRGRHGSYYVPSAPGVVVRPNRNAAGMSYTSARGRHDLDGDALRLAVYGTLDTVRRAASLTFSIEHGVCPCCKSRTAGLRLKSGSTGARRLAALRAKRKDTP